MQQKQNFRNKLIYEKNVDDTRNVNIALAKTALLIAIFFAGEDYSIPFTRVLCAIFVIMIIRAYNENKKAAKRSLLFYDAEVEFRKAAQANDVKRVNEFLDILGELKINSWGPDSGRNALQFAVRGGALDVIHHLLKIQDKLLHLKKFNDKLDVDIINHQDNLNNTPVHDAIQDIINGKRKSYDILFALIARKNEGLDPRYISADGLIPNMVVDPTLVNRQGKTIKDLINEVDDKKNPSYPRAKLFIETIFYVKSGMQQQSENDGEIINSVCGL